MASRSISKALPTLAMLSRLRRVGHETVRADDAVALADGEQHFHRRAVVDHHPIGGALEDDLLPVAVRHGVGEKHGRGRRRDRSRGVGNSRRISGAGRGLGRRNRRGRCPGRCRGAGGVVGAVVGADVGAGAVGCGRRGGRGRRSRRQAERRWPRGKGRQQMFQRSSRSPC